MAFEKYKPQGLFSEFYGMYWKSNFLKDAPAKLCSSFLVVNYNNTHPVGVTILPPRKTDKIDCLIHTLGSKSGCKDEQYSQTAGVSIKIVSSYRWL